MNSVTVGSVVIGDGHPVLIAGPCMAESLELCMECAGYLADLCEEFGVGYVFKASYDKANRTSGRSRRGPGITAGLAMLSEIRGRFNIPVVTDVHESKDVPQVAEVADLLQIPAFLCRQTDLLVAAAESMKPVNIKKGQFMAPEDMFGAVEKVRCAGNRQVILTERGCTFGYHNLVVDFRSLPIMRGFDVPVVFDATHSVQLPGGRGDTSGGSREFVRPLARAATAVGIDALFAEVHPRPDQAWSDGPNSLSFSEIREVVSDFTAIMKIMKGGL